MKEAGDSIDFPPPSAADEDGLLMLGGKLTPSWVLTAYRQGIFPWPLVDDHVEVLAWFSPDPRAILPLDSYHPARRLLRRIRRGEFTVTFNQDFDRVISGCAAPRADDHQTWITRSMSELYQRLHRMGHAHSVETWRDGVLVGGVFGVSLHGLFTGESMFHDCRDASKVALHFLVERLRQRGFELLDIQQASTHMTSAGAVEISRSDYLRRLRRALRSPPQFADALPRPNDSNS